MMDVAVSYKNQNKQNKNQNRNKDISVDEIDIWNVTNDRIEMVKKRS